MIDYYKCVLCDLGLVNLYAYDKHAKEKHSLTVLELEKKREEAEKQG